MKALKQKIQQTGLFSPSEKIDLLVVLDELTEEQRQKLEAVIDEYEQKHRAIGKQFRQQTLLDIEELEQHAGTASCTSVRQASELMKRGLDALFPQNPSPRQ